MTQATAQEVCFIGRLLSPQRKGSRLQSETLRSSPPPKPRGRALRGGRRANSAPPLGAAVFPRKRAEGATPAVSRILLTALRSFSQGKRRPPWLCTDQALEISQMGGSTHLLPRRLWLAAVENGILGKMDFGSSAQPSQCRQSRQTQGPPCKGPRSGKLTARSGAA